MLGDYFIVKDIDEFLGLFKNIEFNREAFASILKFNNIKDYVYNLETNEFLDILFK